MGICMPLTHGGHGTKERAPTCFSQGNYFSLMTKMNDRERTLDRCPLGHRYTQQLEGLAEGEDLERQAAAASQAVVEFTASSTDTL